MIRVPDHRCCLVHSYRIRRARTNHSRALSQPIFAHCRACPTRQWHPLLVQRAAQIHINKPCGHFGDRIAKHLVRDWCFAAPAGKSPSLEHLTHYFTIALGAMIMQNQSGCEQKVIPMSMPNASSSKSPALRLCGHRRINGWHPAY